MVLEEHGNCVAVVIYQCTIINVIEETHPLHLGNYPTITSPMPRLWQVHTHYGIQNVDASLSVLWRPV